MLKIFRSVMAGLVPATHTRSMESIVRGGAVAAFR
jgi:hypothetical protein